jgi:predicted restriction endonuclease
MAFTTSKKRAFSRHKPKRCVLCGKEYPHPDVAHIIDPNSKGSKEWKNPKDAYQEINAVFLCKNCHQAFDEHLRPCLYDALKAFGAKHLPESWQKNNKLTIR